MVMGVVWLLCAFFVLVSQENHSNLSLTALDDVHKWFYHKQGDFRKQKMLNSAKAIVDEQLARASNQCQE